MRNLRIKKKELKSICNQNIIVIEILFDELFLT